MNKGDLFTQLALLPDNDPRLAEIAAVLSGTGRPTQQEAWLSLKQVAARVCRHVVWLARLGVPDACGERLGGRRSYKLSKVEAYLKSDACQARLAQLRRERRESHLQRQSAPSAAAA